MKSLIIPIVFILLIISCDSNNDEITNIEPTPGKAQLIFPENASECIEGEILSETQSEVLFQWTESENTNGYQVNLTNIITKNTKEYSTENNKLSIQIERGTPYSWQVISKSNSMSTKSETWSFYNAGNNIKYYIPFPAENISPINAAKLPSNQTTINLEWNASDLDSDIVEYDINFGESNSPAIYKAQIKETTLNNVPVSTGKAYYWSITTRDAVGNESLSGTFMFQVE
ncbi:hypothetical protein KCTC52924_02898 [Arenibacter antarcticus]|uniref:Fibronectin type-III domain-containing protein n=1 Tax=Arenibacter antarcticus TaxID=2040469 RepID=A0ABW5VHS9_9FLAO|nr:hypothetical protein [Arenibacter sp. H213]MCM4167315.1 hypothetical protein [Arenibacter sp. H213]